MQEYPLRLKKSTHIGLYLAAVVLAGSYNFYRSAGAAFISGPWQEWGSLFNVLQSTLLFALIAQMDLTGLHTRTRSWLARLSNLCFGAYLVSWPFDAVFYWVLVERCPDVYRRFVFIPVFVPIIFCCSLVVSAVINCFYHFISKQFGRRKDRGTNQLSA